MVVAALVAVLVSGSTGAVLAERSSTDFTSSPRSARLLSSDEALGAPSQGALGADAVLLAQSGEVGAALRLSDINSKIQMLELSRPGIGWSIAGIVIGSIMVVPGIILTIVGVVGLAASGAAGTAGGAVVVGALVVLIPGVVLLAGGIVLIALGASGISNAAARNSEIDGQVDQLKQERRQLEAQLGRPITSQRDWAPTTHMMTVAQF